MVCTQFEIPSLFRSQDEDADNRTERTHGDVEGRKKYSHVDLIHMIGGMDAERGTVTAGGRGYYLMGPAVALQQALMQLALQTLMAKDFTPLYTPFFMRKDVMQARLMNFIVDKSSKLTKDLLLPIGGGAAVAVRRGAVQGDGEGERAGGR